MESQSQASVRKTHDVVVIGSGLAGYAAARTAHDAGADVAIVDGLISLCRSWEGLLSRRLARPRETPLCAADRRTPWRADRRPGGGELIQELIAAMHYHGTAADLLHMPQYHPTLAKIVTYPAESIVERSIP